MSASDWVNLSLSILSFILATFSVVTVVLTLKQNNRMIESNSRPYVTIYGDMTNLIIKNFGKSGAVIKDFSCDIDLSKYSYGISITPFESIRNTMLAPGQNIVCSIDHRKLNKDNINVLNFVVEYEFQGKCYKENYPVNYAAFRKNITTKASTEDSELKKISYTLQEIVEKNL